MPNSSVSRGIAMLLRPDRLCRSAGLSMLCAAAVAVALSGCGSQAAPGPTAAPAAPAASNALTTPAAPDAAAQAQGQEGNTVTMKGFMFTPASITVAAGTTVQWKNLDGEPHTVVGIEEPFRSGALDQNDSFSFKFSKPGTYRYACSIHPQMTGTIVVK